MSRHTTTHRHPRHSVLEVRVMSPRLVWLGLRKFISRVVKLACLLALLGGLGWGGWHYIQQALNNNPDFRLRVLTLNPNPVIDELGVAAAAGIDLTTTPSLLEVDVNAVARQLKNLPAIADAHVERHLPGTLVVTITPRIPKAWITSPGAGLTEVRQAGAMLVDGAGIAYPCPPSQLATATTLPVIALPPTPTQPITAGTKINQPALEPCFALLDAAREADPEALQWIESVRQINAWSLLLVTRQGTAATFGMGDHARQITSLRAALDHAGDKGYLIETINLIPKYNIPITLREQPAPPPRAIPVSVKNSPSTNETRRSRDLTTLPKRN